MVRFLLAGPGPRPAYYKVPEHLWGSGCNFDSDGNSDHPEATDWTELTVTLRTARWAKDIEPERVDIDAVGASEPLVLAIASENPDLARKAAEFLNQEAGGELSLA